jgi:hypothetical protein
MDTLDKQHLQSVIKHIARVRENCQILADKLIDNNETELAMRLIANSLTHDKSKLFGAEWLYLREDIKQSHPGMFNIALQNHTSANRHHPEYWGSIKDMPSVYLAEFVCDVTSRSQEFGDNIREWVKNIATKKFDFTVQSNTYREIKKYLDLLLEKPFSQKKDVVLSKEKSGKGKK